MQVAVVGGGVIGVCTAYFLAAAGHDVVVIERYGNVAQETSFGNAGIVAPGYVAPWAMPGMPRKILTHLFKSASPVLLHKKFDPALWRWMRLWLAECELDRYRVNRERMQRLASYSRHLLQSLREHHALEYEQTAGVLQLFRTQREMQLTQPALELLGETDVEHRIVDADEARKIEPALSALTPLAGALYLPQDESGNCALFTRQLKNLAQAAGVEFHFNSSVNTIRSEGSRVSFRIDDKEFSADALVIAAGVDSLRLLEPLGISVPLYPVKGYSATAIIKDYDQAPLASLIDETYKVGISRMGNRIRIAGTAELGATDMELNEAALRTLVKVGEDWFPGGANYNNATFWSGARPMLPDGPPVLGATPVKNVYVNLGHGSSGWAMAAGSGKLLADLISGQHPEINLDGLTLSRYG